MELLTAEKALEQLQQGNERFASALTKGPGRVGSRHQELLKGQWPFAIILSCSDSRAPPEIVFDTRLGDLFVVRVAGNVANTSSIASIEYAVAQLGTKLVVVMGHESCGAVGAAIKGGDAGHNLNRLLGYIQPAVEGSDDVSAVVRRNAVVSANRLIDQSNILSQAVDNDGVMIVTAFMHFTTGIVEFD
jgi:carbonic anhydrase